MTFKRPAYEEVTIAHGGSTVALRPSLRAATILEDKFGVAAIEKSLAEFDYIIVSEIIRTASSSAQDAAAFLCSEAAGRPLSSFFAAVIHPLRDLVAMFEPAPVQSLDMAQASAGEPMSFADMLATLYECATGWLEWSPERAWSATPTEIDRAFMAQVNKLKAIHGNSEGDTKQAKKTDPEQAKRNVAAGLDPEFDRSALHALKAKIAGGHA